MSKRTKRIKNKDDYEKGTKEKKRIISSKISKFANGLIPDDTKLYKCPKCSSNMTHHPSLVSMPLSSSSHDTGNMRRINIGDQDANFVLKFKSCKKCGYSEFYLQDSESSRV